MISNPKNIEFYLEPELREEALEDKDYYEQDVIFGYHKKQDGNIYRKMLRFRKFSKKDN